MHVSASTTIHHAACLPEFINPDQGQDVIPAPGEKAFPNLLHSRQTVTVVVLVMHVSASTTIHHAACLPEFINPDQGQDVIPAPGEKAFPNLLVALCTKQYPAR